jgi:hypothetical protein
VVFGERGLSASHDDIAHEAGVGSGHRLPPLPRQGAADRRAIQARIEEIADVARAAADHPDQWEAFVAFLVRMQEVQSEDRGLKEIVLSGARRAKRGEVARSLLELVLDGLRAECARSESPLPRSTTRRPTP